MKHLSMHALYFTAVMYNVVIEEVSLLPDFFLTEWAWLVNGWTCLSLSLNLVCIGAAQWQSG